MNAFFITALQQYGYPVLWLVVFVAAVGVPVSGSLLLSAAGAFAALGDLNIFILFPVALSAAVMGDSLGYLLGRRVGTALLAWLRGKRWFRWMTPELLERARTYFNSKGGWAIFLTRFLIVVLGGPMNFIAGMEQFPYWKFFGWDVGGQILGAAISLGLGFAFAASWEEVASLFGAFSALFFVLVLALVFAVILVRRLRLRKRALAATAEASEMLHQIAATTTTPSTTTGSLPISD